MGHAKDLRATGMPRLSQPRDLVTLPYVLYGTVSKSHAKDGAREIRWGSYISAKKVRKVTRLRCPPVVWHSRQGTWLPYPARCMTQSPRHLVTLPCSLYGTAANSLGYTTLLVVWHSIPAT